MHILLKINEKFGEISKTWQMPEPPHTALFCGIQITRIFVLSLFQSDGKTKAQCRQAERIDDDLLVSPADGQCSSTKEHERN